MQDENIFSSVVVGQANKIHISLRAFTLTSVEYKSKERMIYIATEVVCTMYNTYMYTVQYEKWGNP